MLLWRVFQFLFFVGATCTISDAFSSPTPDSSVTTAASSALPLSSPRSSKHILYDLPVSNNGARCRLIIYKKGLSSEEVAIVSPMELGGLSSPEFRAINPQGKMPAMTTPTMALGESDTISRYLMSAYATTGPSFQPDNPRSNLMARFHDLYLTTIQRCLYQPSPPFGMYGTRRDALREYQKQLQVLEDLSVEEGLYLCGRDVSYADAAIFPTLVFAKYMMPKFLNGGTVPPKLDRYFERVRDQDAAFGKVYGEMMDVLVGTWEEGRKRWDRIWLAGQRDTDPETIFDKIIARQIPAEIVRETEDIIAFKDINPAAPAHILVIPKDRNGLSRLQKATAEHVEILGKLMVMAGEIAADESLGFGPNGSRIVINDGPNAGQEVPHLHIHVIGGRSMTWPPG